MHGRLFSSFLSFYSHGCSLFVFACSLSMLQQWDDCPTTNQIYPCVFHFLFLFLDTEQPWVLFCDPFHVLFPHICFVCPCFSLPFLAFPSLSMVLVYPCVCNCRYSATALTEEKKLINFVFPHRHWPWCASHTQLHTLLPDVLTLVSIFFLIDTYLDPIDA